jgi:Carboxypeptidase regulatory-like domain
MGMLLSSLRREMICFALFSLPLTVSAQFNASVSGTVEDSSGAVIPGATVSLQNTATQATRSTTSSPQGFYSFSELGPGEYSLTVDAANFKKSVVPVSLGGEARSVDVHLEPGGSSETVTVQGNDVPLLQTADASIGSTVSSTEITRLPTFGCLLLTRCGRA